MRVGKVLGNRSAARAERDDPERMQELDVENANLEGVAGCRAFDEDRPGHRMGAGTALGHTFLNGLERIGDLRLGRSRETHTLQAAGDHRLDPHAIA